MRNLGFVVLFVLIGTFVNAQVTEDFDHNSQSTSEANCWEFDNSALTRPPASKSISVGSSRPLASTSLSGASSTGSLKMPFMLFDGTGIIEFQHKLENATGQDVNLTVTIQDPSGTVVQTIINHDHRSGGANPNGNPTNTNTESVGINYSGYGQVVFTWTGTNANVNGFIDNIAVDGTFSADDSRMSGGYCPAQMYYTDTVCAGDQDIRYTAAYNGTGHTYSWLWSGSPAGTITTGIIVTDSTINVNFDTVQSSTYTLQSVESASQHQTYYNIFVNSLPSVSYSIDSICLEEPYTVELSLTGTGPWTLEYEYTDSGTLSQVITTSTYTLNIPATGDTFNFISLSDANGCDIDAAWMPTVTVPYYPKPVTPPIQH